MKKRYEHEEILSPSNQQMEELRKELRERISQKELEDSWQLEALDHILEITHVDPSTFRRFWIQPLLAAGLSFEVAVARVVDSYFQPN